MKIHSYLAYVSKGLWCEAWQREVRPRALSLLLTIYLVILTHTRSPHINILHCCRSYRLILNLALNQNFFLITTYLSNF